MKNAITADHLATVRSEHKKAPEFSADNTHKAFIVKTYHSARKFTVGVSYFTPEAAALGVRAINGGNRQEIVAPLYEQSIQIEN